VTEWPLDPLTRAVRDIAAIYEEATMTITDDAFVRLFQQRAGLSPVDGWAGKDTLAKLDQLMPPKTTAEPAISPTYWPMLSKIESGDRPFVKAPTSSASGLYQFTRATWEGEGGAWGTDPSRAFGGLTPSTDEQTRRAKTFTAKNAAYLAEHGVPINNATLYAAHFLGRVTAAKVLAADKGASAEALAGAAATTANPSILRGKTVGDFIGWLHDKTGEWAR